MVAGIYNPRSGQVEWREGSYIGQVVAGVSTYAESPTLQTVSYVGIAGEDNK